MLKGKDVQKVSHPKEAAEGLGFVLGLASLQHVISGYASDDQLEDNGDSKRKRAWREQEDRNEDDYDRPPPFCKMKDSSYSLTNLVDLDGQPIVDVETVSLHGSDMLPRDAFEDIAPDSYDWDDDVCQSPSVQRVHFLSAYLTLGS